MADTTSRGFTAAQLYSTQSYQAKDLSGIGLWGNDLTGWDFRGQNLTNANLQAFHAHERQPDGSEPHQRRVGLFHAHEREPDGSGLTGTDFDDTTSRGFTAAQLYSTQSYQAKNLSGIGLEIMT